jgi:hypothetical protein
MAKKKPTKQESLDTHFQAVVEAFTPWPHRVGEALRAEVSVQPADNGRVVITGPAPLYPLLRQKQDRLFLRAELEQIAVAADCVVGVGDTAIVAWWRKDLEPRSRTQTPSRLQQLEEEPENHLFSVTEGDEDATNPEERETVATLR